jgi:dipeptidyl aminopeptidase/acylaminoacyl peptidase
MLHRIRVRIAQAVVAPLLSLSVAHAQTPARAGARFTLDDVMSAPYATNLTAAATGERLAWTLNERGLRNVWVAEGPAFTARRLTGYETDDGQELNDVQISRDGQRVVYMRGGDFGSNWDDELPVNPTSVANPAKTTIWSVPFAGGTPVSLGEGTHPVISPRGDVVVFERARQLWQAPIDGSAPARKLFEQRGSASDAQFSPDGSRIAFVSSRGDHAFIAIYTDEKTPLLYVAPSTTRDWSPRWSGDGKRIVFARRPGAGGPPARTLERQASPWSLWIADAVTGIATQRWASDTTVRASVPSTDGGVNLHWAAANRIVFLSYHDGWPHLYSMSADGRETPMLLTPGDHMAEHITLSADGRYALYAGNLGATAGDLDRRHIIRVPVDKATPTVLTPGAGLEWMPVSLANGRIAGIGGGAQRAPVPFVLDGDPSTPTVGSTSRRSLGESQVPASFPATQLVTPKQIIYTASDGQRVHAQLFEPPSGGPARKAAVVYVHGGPPRQMLLGWHYGDYYWNAYAMNQYLASQGFVVLSINYRLGIGYGHDFHWPARAGIGGASEYLDVEAAGNWLRQQPNVDPARIGIYGGSYGGYLTALALGRNSNIFAAGVDIHGVHDMTSDAGARLGANSWRFERTPAELDALARTAWSSSPVSAVSTWRSPVLLIHADDDRNVRFGQTVDLVQRLRAQGVPFEEITIVDDTHHFMLHANQKRVNAAIAEYLQRKLMPARSPLP